MKTLRKIYKVLKDEDIKFSVHWLPNRVLGYHYEKEIIINIWEIIIPTIVHECLHEVFKDKPEKLILTKEENIYEKMTWRQKQYLIRLFKKAVEKGGYYGDKKVHRKKRRQRQDKRKTNKIE